MLVVVMRVRYVPLMVSRTPHPHVGLWLAQTSYSTQQKEKGKQQQHMGRKGDIHNERGHRQVGA